jgi:hypothetical protein
MSIPTQYLGQGLTGSLGKYQIDAAYLEQLKFLKTGTLTKTRSSTVAINSAANWSGYRNINSKTDFLSNISEQEKAILLILEHNFQSYLLKTGLTASLTQSQIAGLLLISYVSGTSGISALTNVLGSTANLVQVPTNMLVNPVDIFEQPVISDDIPLISDFFLSTQLQALTAQIAKITMLRPVSIPGPLQNLVPPAESVNGSLGKLPGLVKLSGGLNALTAGAGGLTNSLGGAAGSLSKLPGGLAGVPGNLNNFAGKIPSAVTSKTGGILSSLNKVSSIAGNLPGKLNSLAGAVPDSLSKIASNTVADLSLVQQYQAGVHASELGKKIANG